MPRRLKLITRKVFELWVPCVPKRLNPIARMILDYRCQGGLTPSPNSFGLKFENCLVTLRGSRSQFWVLGYGFWHERGCKVLFSTV